MLPSAAWAQQGTFRGTHADGWANSSASVHASQPAARSQDFSSSERPQANTKLKWRPVRSAVARQSEVQLTGGESDRYTAQRVGSGPAARTAQTQPRSVLGAQDPFEADGRKAPGLTVPDPDDGTQPVEDAFPMTNTPSTTKKADPFEADSPAEEPMDTFPPQEPTEEPQSTRPMPRTFPSDPMPETRKRSPRSPSDRDAESNAQTDRVDCEAGRRIVQAGGLDAISLNLYQRGKSGEDYPEECPLWDEMFMDRCWAETNYTWKASSLCHKPLYFEDVQLERYGHEWGPLAQPVISAAHFFGTLPILPYKMGLETPNECVYALGYYRPNSCAPYMIEPIGFTWRAALFDAGAVVGTAAVLP